MACTFDKLICRGQNMLFYAERNKQIDTLVNHAIDQFLI